MGAAINTILQGDCVEKLAEIPKASVDLVFADPPFNIGYEYDVYDDRREAKEYVEWTRRWMSAVREVLQPTGTFWLAIGDEYAAELKLAAQDLDFHCRSWVIWYYTFGVNCARGFSRSHTHLFHFVKDPNAFTFNAENPQVRVPSARQLVYGDRRANSKGRLPDNTWILRPQDAPESFRMDHDTWYFARVAGTFKEREGFHGCQMPEQLLGRIVRVSSNPMDVVLDPFSGSGTTLAVAKKLRRKWIGVELSKEYAARIRKRLKETKVGAELDGPADPVRSAPNTANGRKLAGIRNGLTVDRETAAGVIAAFEAVSSGRSADYMLCEPNLNADFVSRCQRLGIAGDAETWNRTLLRVRKAGRLPRCTKSERGMTFERMDAYSFASEIAMHVMEDEYGLTLDEALCCPATAKVFDEIASGFAPNYSSFEYRWAAFAIRKRASKAKALASDESKKWKAISERISRRSPLDRCIAGNRNTSGVYILSNGKRPKYVGETRSLGERLEKMLDIESPEFDGQLNVKFVTDIDLNSMHGFQSYLIYQHHSKRLLNSRQLYPTLSGSAA